MPGYQQATGDLMTSPAVSVCIPVYRGEQFLAETIRSVLEQTYRDFELVILDNASPDDTGRIARSFRDGRIRVETNSTVLPQPQNWRHAVELCRAPLIKLVCADDLLHPRCLELQAILMDLDPSVAVVAARCHMIDESSRILVSDRGLVGMTGLRTHVEVARRVVRSAANPIGDPGGVLFRREHYDAVGGWNAERSFAMDLDLWLRLLRHGDFFGRSESLAATRISRTSLSALNAATIDRHQSAITDELIDTAELDIRLRDRLIGRLNTPLTRQRRRLLFALSSIAARRDARSRGSQPATAANPTPDDTTSDDVTGPVARRPRAAAERADDVNVSD
jgi:glycosyltransferase involved in cell wall biosynthesis